MRAFLMLAVLLVVAFASVNAAVPTTMNYQGYLTDAGGVAVADGSYSVDFTIYTSELGSSTKWTETQSVTTSGGIFAVLLGTINPLEDTVFNDTPRYLGMAVDGDPELTPRTMMATVPYAFNSGSGGEWIRKNGTDIFAKSEEDYVRIGLENFSSTPKAKLAVSNYVSSGASPPAGAYISASSSDNYAYGMWVRASGSGSNTTKGITVEAINYSSDASLRGINAKATSSFSDDVYAGYFDNKVGIFDGTNDTLSIIGPTSQNSGAMTLWGASGSRNVRLTHMTNIPDYGAMGIFNDINQTKVDMLIYDNHPDSGNGVIRTFGANGSFNLILSGTNNNRNNGAMSIYDEVGTEQVSMYIDHPDGDGIVSTDQLIVEARGSETGDHWAILPDDAIHSEEILNESGIASQQVAAGATLVSANMTDIETVTITTPAPGYIFVTGRTYLRTSGATTSNYINTQIDETAGGTYLNPQSTKVGMATYPSTGFYYYTPTATRVYYKGSAGSYTFRLEGMASGASHTTYGYSGTVTAMYFPTSYGSVATLASTPGDGLNAEVVQVMEDEDPSVTKTMYQVDLRELELKAAKTRAAAVEAELELHKAQKRQSENNSEVAKIQD